MACFLVPATEALATTLVKKALDGKVEAKQEDTRIPFTRKLKWLNNMLWGGSALLAFEHAWHGEIVPFFPFLTAAANSADAAEMLGEMSTVGVSMAILVTAAWVGMVVVSDRIVKRPVDASAAVR